EAGGVRRLVEGLAAAKTEPAVQLQGRRILSGHFQECAAQPIGSEPFEGLQKQGRAEAPPTVGRQHAQVLDRALAAGIAESLDRAAATARTADEPRCPGQEPGLVA